MPEHPVLVQVPDESPTCYVSPPQGLQGYWWETDRLICVPLVISDQEGQGHFSRWLKELETKGKIVFFPSIVSARLDAILRRKGYVEAFTVDKDFGVVDGLAKMPQAEKSPWMLEHPREWRGL